MNTLSEVVLDAFGPKINDLDTTWVLQTLTESIDRVRAKKDRHEIDVVLLENLLLLRKHLFGVDTNADCHCTGCGRIALLCHPVNCPPGGKREEEPCYCDRDGVDVSCPRHD